MEQSLTVTNSNMSMPGYEYLTSRVPCFEWVWCQTIWSIEYSFTGFDDDCVNFCNLVLLVYVPCALTATITVAGRTRTSPGTTYEPKHYLRLHCEGVRDLRIEDMSLDNFFIQNIRDRGWERTNWEAFDSGNFSFLAERIEIVSVTDVVC